MLRIKNSGFVRGMLCLVFFAWLFQSSFWLNGEVSWNLLATERMLNGGTYVQDFYQQTPPLSFILYSPVVWLNKLFHIRLDLGLRLYVFALALFSLTICRSLLGYIFREKDKFPRCFMLAALAVVFLIAPGYEFAQPEHLFMVFSLPYFLTAAYRLRGNKLKPLYAIAIGLFAFFGFAINPYFILAMAMAETYMMYRTRSRAVWFRPETVTIILSAILYVIWTCVFFPEYIHVVLPVSLRYYQSGYFDPIHAAWGYLSYGFVLLSGVFLAGSLECKRAHQTALSGLVVVIAVLMAGTSYFSMQQYKNQYSDLLSYMTTNAKHQAIMLLSASSEDLFPLVYYANAGVGSRFMDLFWMPALVKVSGGLPLQNTTPQQTEDQGLFMDYLAANLKVDQPKYIFVDVRESKPLFSGISFDYLDYLQTSPRFKEEFSHYRYVTTLANSPIYKLAIYERDNSDAPITLEQIKSAL